MVKALSRDSPVQDVRVDDSNDQKLEEHPFPPLQRSVTVAIVRKVLVSLINSPHELVVLFNYCRFLDLLLTNETFRRELNSVQFRNFLHEQQFYSWQSRSRHLYGAGGNEDAAAKSDGADADGATGVAAQAAVAK